MVVPMTWVVLLMLLNLSIDPPDSEAPGQEEDISVNEIESVVELVAEQWLGLEDFLPEGDESDDSGFAKKLVEYRCTTGLVDLLTPQAMKGMALTYPFAEQFTVQYEPEPRVPPPWA